MPIGERRLAAIMFTDVVGFTSMGQTNEALMLEVLQEQRQVVREKIPDYHGVEVKTVGDAFLVEFGSALEAVQCAVDIQKAMRERNSRAPEGRRVEMRIGVHVGDVVHSQGDILGDAVNVSSRIEPLARPGGVCISEQAYDHVRNKVGFPMEKLERKTLKNVNVPIEVYRIVMPWEVESKQEGELDSKRVAVLPLKNMSPDPNDEYFADGMTEELITSLSSVTELTVIARTSVMQYKNAPKRVADVGRELSVGTVIEGSVRKAGNKVRITVQMIDAKNEGHLWAQNYDKQLDDVFVVQSEVAEKVAEALKVKLVEAEKKRLEKVAERNPAANNIFLQGMFYMNKRTPEAMKKSIELFEEAVRMDPSFALAYAGIAQAYNIIASNVYQDPLIFFPKAKEYALKALSLDDDLAEAHAVLAAVYSGFDRDIDRSDAEFRRAIELNPSYPTAHQWLSQLLNWQGRFEEGFAEIMKAHELSPLSLIINTNISDGRYYRREYEMGIEQAKKVIEMDPSFVSAYPSLLQNLVWSGRVEEAWKVAEEYKKVAAPIDVLFTWAYITAQSGKAEEARKYMEEIESKSKKEYVPPYFVACIYVMMEDKDRGFAWLEKAFETHDRNIMAMGIDRELEGARSDPRYKAMMERLGLAGRIRDRA